MEGGINAWKGLVARGAPEAGMAYFDEARSPEELATLAWLLEEASRKFYAKMAGKPGNEGAAGLFQELAADEERHRNSLLELYRGISGKTGTGRPQLPGAAEPLEYLEGGMSLGEALDWMRRKSVEDALDLSISLEANASDLYIKMERRMHGAEEKRVFQTLVGQERSHLKKLSAFLGKSQD